jgi:hypothetical protein
MKYFLLISICTFATVANAQSRYYPPARQIGAANRCRDGSKPIPILQKDSFKLRAANSVSSETARVADYLEFRTMEPVYSDQDYPTVLFEKDTSIYAVVTRRKNRHFPFVRGKLEIALEPLRTWDNKRIEMAIARLGKLDETVTGRLGPKELEKRNKGINKPCKVNEHNCIAGRGNATVSVVVTAIAGASGAAVSAVSKDDDTKFIAATSFFSIAKDLGNLLNGTDVGIGKDEIFNLQFGQGSAVCAVPKEPKKDAPPTKIEIVKPSR